MSRRWKTNPLMEIKFKLAINVKIYFIYKRVIFNNGKRNRILKCCKNTVLKLA